MRLQAYCYCNVTLGARESIGGHLKLSHCFLFASGTLRRATTRVLLSLFNRVATESNILFRLFMCRNLNNFKGIVKILDRKRCCYLPFEQYIFNERLKTGLDKKKIAFPKEGTGSKKFPGASI